MHLAPVYLNDIPIGTFCCRLENQDGKCKLYLMTMGVLAVSPSSPRIYVAECLAPCTFNLPQPYRSRKIGSQCLTHLLEAVEKHKKPEISSIYLHVHIANKEAQRFYERHGFKESGYQKDYYKKIEPRDAWILERECGT